ncbi:hypothetical protein JJB09_26140 [Rhizobium sp. KVB221]|uniref:Uncharacterized protein n=1 Tax=Rhizobium setariae TaxID=2801340 RepID=A0A936YWV0_9HYPH|nr:hypothetical protein [Rhizobium setariae]MBL0375492.1 hypothetical protein [Rhizobium setariae]
MSSDNRHEFLTSTDLQMLERVLKRAGFRGTEATVDPNKMGKAARFLIDHFRNGNDSEDSLTDVLEKRGFETGSGKHRTPKQEKSEAIDRWVDEGGS